MNSELFNILSYGLLYVVFIIILCLIHFSLSKIHVVKRTGKYFALNDILITIILVVISSIRCNFGSDYYEYFKIYNFADFSNISFKNFNFLLDQGYYLLANLSKQISDSEFFIFGAVAILVYPFIIRYFRKYSINVTMSIFIFLCLDFFTITNNILKQSLSLVCLIFLYEKILKKDYIGCFILSILSISFHLSSIIVILLMIFSKFKFNKQLLMYIIMFFTLFVLVFYDPILNFIIINFKVFSTYDIYRNSSSSIIFVFSSLMYFLILIYSYFKINSKLIGEEDYSRLNLIILTIPFVLFSIRYVTVIRIAYVGIFQLCILLPKYISLFHYKNSRLKIHQSALYLLIAFIIITICSGNNRYYDYSTIYDSIPTQEWYR